MWIDWDYDWYCIDGERWCWCRICYVVLIEEGVLLLDGEGVDFLFLRAFDWGDY